MEFLAILVILLAIINIVVGFKLYASKSAVSKLRELSYYSTLFQLVGAFLVLAFGGNVTFKYKFAMILFFGIGYLISNRFSKLKVTKL